jgi:hypothetical protein
MRSTRQAFRAESLQPFFLLNQRLCQNRHPVRGWPFELGNGEVAHPER